jgi:mannobiose 2-epimerase
MKQNLVIQANKKLILYLLLVLIIVANSCSVQEKSAKYLGVEIKQIESELNTLLSCYYPKNIDSINGGFYADYDSTWKMLPNQSKMIVTQSRYLWTASKALSYFPENKTFRLAADHGFKYLTEKMWDNKNGGFNQYYIKNDSAENLGSKTSYGNAFALFAISEYAKVNKDPEVLGWVSKVFQWMDDNAHDSIYKGYYSVVSDKGFKNPGNKVNSGLNRGILGKELDKDQNSSIHILEALTTTYQVLKNEKVKQRLAEMLQLVSDTMVTPDGYLNLYFNRNWAPYLNCDSSEQYIRKNIYFDHISFGHNIETAYLIIDASISLNGKVDPKSLEIAKKLVDHTLANGFDKQFYGLLDKGYQFKGQQKIEIMDSTKVWWAQAESLNALALMSSYYPNEKIYGEAFYNMWQYVEKEIIDHKNGGWYDSGLDKSPKSKFAPKAQMWKANYHDGRSLMLLLEYAKKSGK